MITQPFISNGQQAFGILQNLWPSIISPSKSPQLPTTSPSRLISTTHSTILYLAYGSNLSAQTFKGTRGIKPLSALNVHVPSLTLTFDLPGIPYREPCFANTRYSSPPPPSNTEHRKDRWHKGVVGVVYEVTPEDYRTIIATEGGGASYHDVVVPCYAIAPGSKTIDAMPSGIPFLAHTLLRPSPSDGSKENIKNSEGVIRPNPSYAQASARYLNLLTSGGEEHALPEDYMAYLYSLRPYTITTMGQRMGLAVIVAVWVPMLLFVLALGKVFADDDGKVPDWLAGSMGMLMKGIWGTYDRDLKKRFGDGERTIGDEEDEEKGTNWVRDGERVEMPEKSVTLT
ncbi:gliotoxin biosynthesis protein GliK [Diplocarpon rosae]|nr:gliotoxin biosynthesis protein GliK [Diplocarpon rosae]